MIETPEVQKNGGGARPSLLTVVYACRGRTYVVRLDPARVPVVFFDRERRDEVWGREADVTVLRADDDWESVEGLVSGPEETDEPAHSADCFCFEDDMGTRYCVCGMM